MPRFGVLDTRSARPAPKVADAELLTPEHQVFRAAVLKRAGYRCEWVEAGQRCSRRAPDRLVADHKRERKDGGAFYDPANGQCLCIAHNTLKGAKARARRHGAALPG